MFAGLRPHSLLALRTTIINNAHFVSDSEILYPAGAVLVLHDFPRKQQRYLQLMDKSSHLEMIIVSPSRTLAAIIINDDKGHIIIYDIKTLKKKRTLNLPHDAVTKRFEYMCFSFDEKLLLTLTGHPDWVMLSFNWEKGKVETFTRANYINNPGPVSQVLCSPTDSATCCLIGPSLFRMMIMQETVWRQYGFQKADQVDVTTAAFLGGDRILVGTAEGRLLLVDNGELKAVYDAVTVERITITEKDEASGGVAQPVMVAKGKLKEGLDKKVRTIIAFNRGFAYSCLAGKVHMFEAVHKNMYKRRNLFVILDEDFRENQTTPLNIVNHLSTNPGQDTLLATTNRSQLYTVRLWGPDIEAAPEIPFKHLGQSLHHGQITGLAMCTWKPLFMTCGGADRTVRMWNYETGSLEMLKQYEENVLSVALHPTALFAAIGFTEQLRYMIVLLDNIQPIRTFPIPECELSSFSPNGQYLAAVHKTGILIYSTISFNILNTFRGHGGKITSLVWTPDDRKLVSCGVEGAVYEWDLATGNRISEIVEKGTSFWECAVTPDGKYVYAAGNDGLLKEVTDSNITRTFGFEQKDLPHVVLSRSGMMMFICGDAGSVCSVKLPLIEPIDKKFFYYHNTKILNVQLTYDDKTLVTVSEAGTLCIWDITDAEELLVSIDKDFSFCTDVLIPKEDLEDKVAKIKELRQRMQELTMEQEYRLRQNEISHSQEIREIHATYNKTIEELKAYTEKTEQQHLQIEKELQKEIVTLKETSEVSKLELEGFFNAKLIIEYEKVIEVQKEKWQQALEYEAKIEEIIQTKDQNLYDMKIEFLKKIGDLDNKVQQLKKENNQEKEEHEEIKQQIEDDADREIIELKAAYEKNLKEERDLNVKIRSEAGVMKKKLGLVQKDNDKYKMDIGILQEEQKMSEATIQELNKDISDLKREIYERDLTIQDKEKRIYDMKKKNEELEKYKFVLGHKIEELKNQLEPKELELSEKVNQIAEMEVEMDMLQTENSNLEVHILESRKKQQATDGEVQKLKDKCSGLRSKLKKVGVDILNVSNHLQDMKKLKNGVKDLYTKYAQSDEVAEAHQAQTMLEAELLRQRDHLAKTVHTLTESLQRTREKPSDAAKTMKENVMLIEEINELRQMTKLQQDKIIRYERLLLTSSGKVLSLRDVKKKLDEVLKTHDEIRQEMRDELETIQNEARLLKAEINRLRKN